MLATMAGSVLTLNDVTDDGSQSLQQRETPYHMQLQVPWALIAVLFGCPSSAQSRGA